MLPGTTSKVLELTTQDAAQYIHGLEEGLRQEGFEASGHVLRGDPAGVIVEAAERAKARAWYLLITPFAGGLVAEIMKLLLRRERPNVLSGDYSFRLWSENPFSTSGLAWPSSHTMVAFAAATISSSLTSRIWP